MKIDPNPRPDFREALIALARAEHRAQEASDAATAAMETFREARKKEDEAKAHIQALLKRLAPGPVSGATLLNAAGDKLRRIYVDKDGRLMSEHILIDAVEPVAPKDPDPTEAARRVMELLKPE